MKGGGKLECFKYKDSDNLHCIKDGIKYYCDDKNLGDLEGYQKKLLNPITSGISYTRYESEGLTEDKIKFKCRPYTAESIATLVNKSNSCFMDVIFISLFIQPNQYIIENIIMKKEEDFKEINDIPGCTNKNQIDIHKLVMNVYHNLNSQISENCINREIFEKCNLLSKNIRENIIQDLVKNASDQDKKNVGDIEMTIEDYIAMIYEQKIQNKIKENLGTFKLILEENILGGESKEGYGNPKYFLDYIINLYDLGNIVFAIPTSEEIENIRKTKQIYDIDNGLNTISIANEFNFLVVNITRDVEIKGKDYECKFKDNYKKDNAIFKLVSIVINEYPHKHYTCIFELNKKWYHYDDLGAKHSEIVELEKKLGEITANVLSIDQTLPDLQEGQKVIEESIKSELERQAKVTQQNIDEFKTISQTSKIRHTYKNFQDMIQNSEATSRCILLFYMRYT